MRTETVAPSTEADLLAAFLAGRDVPCPRCGYNLRELSGSRCPECGEQLTLCVNLVEPRQAALIAGVIALAAGFGLNGLLLIYWVVMDRMRGLDEFFYCNAFGAAVEGVALAVWLRGWRGLRRRAGASRWVGVVGCLALTTADLIVFIKYIR